MEQPNPDAPSPLTTFYPRDGARPAPYRGLVSEGFRLFCATYLKLMGWKMEGDWPAHSKLVLIAAPHTANIDGFNMVAAAAYFRIKLRWMGKASLVKGPLGWLVRWAGCVPVQRSGGLDIVEQMRNAFDAHDEFVLAVAPEGTRARTESWKTGFYHIARTAQVPIVMSVLDYGSKTIRLSGELIPSGDMEADIAAIKTHYATAAGKIPELFTLDADAPAPGLDP